MRGKGPPERDVQDAARITPAYAGKSWLRKRAPSTVWDHPRVCGEKAEKRRERKVRRGSPPRMQGKVHFLKVRLNERGITPARAGKSSLRWAAIQTHGDHPRVCGEKLSTTSTDIHPAGSPPRMRGKELAGALAGGVERITPAYAGKRVCRRLSSLVRRDHPRVCGEKSTSTSMINCGWGSPPRMRGKAQAEQPLPHVAGITPACAGKSSIQHLTASLGEFKVQKGHPVPHLRQRLQVWPDPCPASPPWSYPPRITVSRPRP